MQVFRETGAYLKGHFRLTSGLHSNEYLQCAQVLQYPQLAERFGRELAAQLPDCEVVVSPAIGGLRTAHYTSPKSRARCAPAPWCTFGSSEWSLEQAT